MSLVLTFSDTGDGTVARSISLVGFIKRLARYRG